MTQETSYINELVKANIEILINGNIDEILKYLSLKGYKFTKPPKEIHDAYTFENAWNLYQKKVGDKSRLNKKWNSMSLKDRKAATEYIPSYVLSTPDKQYRKNFQTFLNQRGWEDEIVGAAPPTENHKPAEEPSSISKLIDKTKEDKLRFQTRETFEGERKRLLGLIDLIKKNPLSSAKISLINYYRSGYLQKFGILWQP